MQEETKELTAQTLRVVGCLAMEAQGYELARSTAPGYRHKPSIYVATRGDEVKLVCIRTSQDGCLAFSPNEAGTGFDVLDDPAISSIIGVIHDPIHFPDDIRVHEFSREAMAERFGRAMQARLAAGHVLKASVGLWVDIYTPEQATPNLTGAGIGLDLLPFHVCPVASVQHYTAKSPKTLTQRKKYMLLHDTLQLILKSPQNEVQMRASIALQMVAEEMPETLHAYVHVAGTNHWKAMRVPKGLAGIQAVVGGAIEVVTQFDGHHVLYCHEEGKLLKLPASALLLDHTGQPQEVLMGNLIAFGTKDCDETDANPATLQMLCKYLRLIAPASTEPRS